MPGTNQDAAARFHYIPTRIGVGQVFDKDRFPRVRACDEIRSEYVETRLIEGCFNPPMPQANAYAPFGDIPSIFKANPPAIPDRAPVSDTVPGHPEEPETDLGDDDGLEPEFEDDDDEDFPEDV